MNQNQLVAAERAAPAPIRDPFAEAQAKRVRDVAKGLRDIRRDLLDDREAYYKLRLAHRHWHETLYWRAWPEHDPEKPLEFIRLPDTASVRDRWIETCREKLDALPPMDSGAVEILARLRDQAQAPFDAKLARLVVGYMTGAFPNARPHDPITYVEAIVDALCAHNIAPAPLAAACDQIKQSSKFLPTVSEVLEAAQEKAADWSNYQGKLERTIKARAHLEDAIEALEAMTGLPE